MQLLSFPGATKVNPTQETKVKAGNRGLCYIRSLEYCMVHLYVMFEQVNVPVEVFLPISSMPDADR